MNKSGASQGRSASELISKRIAELRDWRGETLSRMRALIKKAAVVGCGLVNDAAYRQKNDSFQEYRGRAARLAARFSYSESVDFASVRSEMALEADADRALQGSTAIGRTRWTCEADDARVHLHTR
jgi:hypothetical protein